VTAKAPAYLQPAAYGVHEAASIQALQAGTATPHQQKTALDWIINAAAGAYDLSFSPDSDRGTAFAEGRRFVGLQIVKLTKISVDKLKQG
jgi:hypothetical protein